MVSTERTPHTLTRRGLIASGGAAGAAALAALNPGVSSAVVAIGQDPAYLRRSGYARLVGQDFTAGGWGTTARLTLAEIADIGGMSGRDDAFALRFASQADLESGTHALYHPSLGSFNLLVSPVNAAGASQEYEAIVDRSHGLTRRAAPKPPSKQPPSRPTGHHPRKLVAHAQLREGRHGLRCEIVFADGAHVRRAHATLMRDGKPVAASGSHKVHDHRVVLKLPTERRLRRGRYELVVLSGDRAQSLAVKLR
ncbi:MAG TPA: hypothetical protein VJT75_15870 [Thermoleophilaceae bacterium]|nr:hypothetical protein [Thermoleophilaceae bacterium]